LRRFLVPWFAVQFFTWLALFALWIYATPVFAEYLFHARGGDAVLSQRSVTWVGVCFALYNLLAASLSFGLPLVIRKYGAVRVHSFALLCGAIGFGLISRIGSPGLMLLPFVFIGIAWCSISNTPYVLVSGRAPSERIAHYMSIFSFSVVIPQIIAAFLLDLLVRHVFAGDKLAVMTFGAASLALASFLCLLWCRDK
jgi:hypothetical protein